MGHEWATNPGSPATHGFQKNRWRSWGGLFLPSQVSTLNSVENTLASLAP
jgi:hypothetical protein